MDHHHPFQNELLLSLVTLGLLASVTVSQQGGKAAESGTNVQCKKEPSCVWLEIYGKKACKKALIDKDNIDHTLSIQIRVCGHGRSRVLVHGDVRLDIKIQDGIQ